MGFMYLPFATSSSVLQNTVLYYHSSVLLMTGIRLVEKMSFSGLVRSPFSAFTTDKRF